MRSLVLAHEVDFDGWRRAARALALAGVPPDLTIWSVGEAGEPPHETAAGGFSVPRSLVELAGTVIQARDPARFGLLYALIWRAHRGEKALLEDAADPQVRQAQRLAQAVRRDTHRMRATLRFHAVTEGGAPRQVAWFEPEHFIVEASAAYFAERHAAVTWSILTPYRSLHWQAGVLRMGPGASRSDVPEGEVQDVAAAESLAALAADAAGCRLCPLWQPATQTVFGHGPVEARLMLVGEQPGDMEDLAGLPFVGPAGQVLDRALAEAGIDRSQVYVTNAVKHFKFEPRGKRRLHATPSPAEIEVCRFWLDQERAVIRPSLVVLLGASAARAVLNRAVTISRERGRPLPLPGGKAFVTVHPSYLLRLPDEASRRREYAAFVSDLRAAKALA